MTDMKQTKALTHLREILKIFGKLSVIKMDPMSTEFCRSAVDNVQAVILHLVGDDDSIGCSRRARNDGCPEYCRGAGNDCPGYCPVCGLPYRQIETTQAVPACDCE